MLDHLEACSTFKYLAIDTEGWAPKPLGISIAHPLLRGMYFPLNHKEDVNIDEDVHSVLRDTLTNIPYRILHNAAHDLHVLPYLLNLPFIDTMIVGHMVNENVFDKSLESLHKTYCGGEGKVKDPLMQSIIDTMGWEWVPFELMNKYATQDAVVTMELFLALKPLFEEQFGPFWS